jgi:histidyl-tRNA synthetase
MGFGMGIERILMLMEKQNCDFLPQAVCDLYIASIDNTHIEAVKLANQLREDGHCVEYDLMERSLNAQMKYANKLGALFTMVLGGREIEEKTAKIKNMTTGESFEMKLDDINERFMDISITSVFEERSK